MATLESLVAKIDKNEAKIAQMYRLMSSQTATVSEMKAVLFEHFPERREATGEGNGTEVNQNAEGTSTNENRMYHILEKFANQTFLHGVSRVILGKSLVIRCLWMFLFLGAVSICGYQTTLLARRYFSYPVKVTIITVDNDAPFPMIIFSPMNPMEPIG